MKAIARPATLADVPALCAIQAQIILIGGTTAHEHPFAEPVFAERYLTGAGVICCHAATVEGRPVGFQVVTLNPALPAGWADIGTFVDPRVQRSGAGQALFAATRAAARQAGIATLNATIRSDNAPGLGYYGGLGFRDYAGEPGYALKSGRIVGRVHRRFDL
ncbi:MAG: GNAT family N-acetyltransferase [Paracoccaceae bacterium]